MQPCDIANFSYEKDGHGAGSTQQSDDFQEFSTLSQSAIDSMMEIDWHLHAQAAMNWAAYQDGEEAAAVAQHEADEASSLQARWAAAPPLHACPPARHQTAHKNATEALRGLPDVLAEPLLYRSELLQVRRDPHTGLARRW